MDENTFKHRIVGAIVLVTMGVIFIPMLLSGHRDDVFHDENVIPAKPTVLESMKVYELENPIPEPSQQPVKRTPVDKQSIQSKKASQSDKEPKGANKPDKKAADTPTKNYPVAKAAHVEPQKPVTQPVEKAWAVQVGSFGKRENAMRLRDKLRSKGYPAFVEKITTKNQSVYRVRIGPEVRREKAEKIQKDVNRKLGLKSFVVAHP